MDELLAGAAVVDITPGIGLRMGGYGARKFPADAVHDPLHVRALVLRQGETALAYAACDLVGAPRILVDEARRQVAELAGIPASHVCIAATHTHSGPLLQLETVPSLVTEMARKIATAVDLAGRNAKPVTLKAATTPVTTVGRNRRSPDGPIDTEARILLADPGAPDPPIATLVNYGCHATVLEWDNIAYSADYPGAMARALAAATGSPAIFMQGACGDINPLWMRHDFAETERIGGILGAAAARTVHELRPLGSGQWVVNLNWSEDLPVEPAPGIAVTEPTLAAVSTTVELPRRTFDLAAIDAERDALKARLDAIATGEVEARRSLRPRFNRLGMERARGAAANPDPGATQQVEVQAFRLSRECAIVTLPGEFFVETGREIARRSGIPHLFIAGYANDFISYVPPEREFPNDGYEVGCALFEPGAESLVADAAVALLGDLCEAPR